MNEETFEIKLQRLTDAEMTDADRREFLRSIDERPELWREVALAFVEEQIWASEVNLDMVAPVKQVTPTPPPSRSRVIKLWGMRAALAACLALLPCLGFMMGQNRGGVPESAQQVADGNQTHSQTRETPTERPAELSPAEQTQLRLASLGYQLESKTEYYTGMLDDGHQVVLPVQKVMVNYRGQ